MIKKEIPLDRCPFCSPDNQRNAFASSSSFLALYNIAPILPGHSIIIPRKHIKSLRSLSNELASEFFLFARQVTGALLTYYKADAFDWSLQDNGAAGQTIPHLHLHIIIRHPSDLTEPGDWYPLLDEQSKNGSDGRFRLNKDEYTRITGALKAAYSKVEKDLH